MDRTHLAVAENNLLRQILNVVVDGEFRVQLNIDLRKADPAHRLKGAEVKTSGHVVGGNKLARLG